MRGQGREEEEGKNGAYLAHGCGFAGLLMFNSIGDRQKGFSSLSLSLSASPSLGEFFSLTRLWCAVC